MITSRYETILGEIPDGWKSKRLCRLLSSHFAGSWGDADGEREVQVIRSTNFNDTGFLDLTDVAKRYYDQKREAAICIKKNDILIERSGGGPTQPVGRVALVESDLSGYGFSNFVQLLRPNEDEIHPEYLAWVLFELHRSGIIERLQHQTTQMRNLDYRDYIRIRLPVPPGSKQGKIVEIVKISNDALINVKTELQAARRLKTALMQQLFTKGIPGRHRKFIETKWLKGPENWKSKRLFEIADITSGFTMGRDLSRYETETVPYITVGNVKDGYLDLSQVGQVKVKTSELETLQLKSGDILVTEGGDRDKLGRGAVWRDEIEPCVYQNHIFRIRLMPDSYLPGLFHFFLQTHQVKSYFYSRAKQTSNLCTVNSREVKKLPLLIPDPEEQKQMLEILSASEKSIERIKEQYEALLRLKKSLLQNLLTGKVRLKTEVLK